MPAITYIALRSITRLAFQVLSKTDIKADSITGTNFFNSVAGDFLGLNVGDWIFVTGFITSANNGWHQLAFNSNTNGITVTGTLIPEAAGNTITILGYLRGFGISYSFDLGMQQDDRQRLPTKTVLKSLAGNVETLTDRREDFFQLTTLPINNNEYNQVIEFLDSCESDEGFTFDRTGTVATPVNPVGARIEGNGYTETRMGNAYRAFSFKIVLT